MGDFEEIKKVFLDSFEKCEVINQTTVIQAEFDHKVDAEWFKTNIAYPEDLAEDELPIHVVVEISPIGETPSISVYDYIFKFKVKDKEKLLDMLKNKK